jgi:hypothetical protein
MSAGNIWRACRAFLFVAILTIFVAVPAFAQCGPMDVVFIIDNSGSMGNVISEVQTQVKEIADAVQAASGGDYQFGLIPMPANDVVVALDLAAGNRAAFDTAVQTMSTQGSSGLGIAYDEALDTVLNHLGPRQGSAGAQTGTFSGTWRPNATKIIIIITDTGPQGFDSSLGTHGDKAHSMAVLASTLGIRVTGIFVPTGGGTDPAIDRPILQDVAAVSGGLFKETAPDASDLADVIIDIIKACGGAGGTGITSLTIAPLELFLTNGESGVVNITNYNPASKVAVPTTYTAYGLPADSTITFTNRKPDVDNTEAREMKITIGPETMAGTYAVVIKASREGVRDNYEYVLVYVDCIPPYILGTPGNQPASQTVARNATASLSVIPRGNGPYTYQWYRGQSGSTAFPIAGANSATFTTPAITDTSSFWVRVSNACGTRDSATAVITPNP